MENICLEELRYLNEEIKKNQKAFDMSVRINKTCNHCKTFISSAGTLH